MFGPSLKSVPGCFVSIVPMLIGVPVALTPGLLPHDDVLADAVLALLLLELAAPPVLLLLLLLLPQAASTTARTTANAASAPAVGTFPPLRLIRTAALLLLLTP
jgi:hypothetical protein